MAPTLKKKDQEESKVIVSLGIAFFFIITYLSCSQEVHRIVRMDYIYYDHLPSDGPRVKNRYTDFYIYDDNVVTALRYNFLDTNYLIPKNVKPDTFFITELSNAYSIDSVLFLPKTTVLDSCMQYEKNGIEENSCFKGLAGLQINTILNHNVLKYFREAPDVNDGLDEVLFFSQQYKCIIRREYWRGDRLYNTAELQTIDTTALLPQTE